MPSYTLVEQIVRPRHENGVDWGTERIVLARFVDLEL